MRKNGFTLLEILLAVAIVAVLTVILIVSAGGLRRQAQTQFTESTLAVIMTAIQQYHEFWGNYPPQYDTVTVPLPKTPVEAIADAIGRDQAEANVQLLPVSTHADVLTGSEVLYLYLSQTPTSRKVISPITDKGQAVFRMTGGRLVRVGMASSIMFAIQDDGTGKPTKVKWNNVMQTTPPTKKKPGPAGEKDLGHFIDAWQTPLWYQYKTTDQFPVLRSAGPDGQFDTPDDIKSGRM